VLREAVARLRGSDPQPVPRRPSGSGFFGSEPRFLLPAFPLPLPSAPAPTKTRPRTAVVVTVAPAGLSCAYGTNLLTLPRRRCERL
jgi:hypothetical protein